MLKSKPNISVGHTIAAWPTSVPLTRETLRTFYRTLVSSKADDLKYFYEPTTKRMIIRAKFSPNGRWYEI